MAGSYNRMTIIGNLGHDPRTRSQPDGTPLVTFDVAVNEWRQVDGRVVQATQWFHVECRGTLADRAVDRLARGRAVLVEGPLQVRSYRAQTGQHRIALDVRARELRVLDQPSGHGSADVTPDGAVSAGAPEQAAGADQAAPAPHDDLDLPPF